MSILIVRHAQSAANAGARTADQGAIPITDLGARQAQCVADFVPERPSVVVVSRFLRSVQTAAPLLHRFSGLQSQEWPIEEFTYLDPAVCAGTTYADRAALRDAYWTRCDPAWVDGLGCESFADFITRVRWLEQALSNLRADETAVVITHGFVMKALLWLQQDPPVGDMAAFDNFHRGISVPNCAILIANRESNGRLRLPAAPSVAHLPVDLQTE